MRVALLSDIHGNLLALEAVLTDIVARDGVDEYWLLGDYCTVGYDPAGVLERLNQLPNAIFIRGNNDRYIVTGHLPPPTFKDVEITPALLPKIVEVAGSFAWTSGYVTARGWLQWIAQLPLEHTLKLPNGTQVLLVHAEPGNDDGDGLNPSLSDDVLSSKLESCLADLICVGHFHLPIDRTIRGKRVINPGSVSNPIGSHGLDLRPSYAILTATDTNYDITFHRVDYDLNATLDAVRNCGIPGSQFIVRSLSGHIGASWLEKWDGKSHLAKPSNSMA